MILSWMLLGRGETNETMQSLAIASLWNEINSSDICIGGVVFEYCDEWWKVIWRFVDHP
jgi:hypothetical protein